VAYACPWPPPLYRGSPDASNWKHYTSNDLTAQPRTLDGASWYFENGDGTTSVYGSSNGEIKCKGFVGSSMNVNYCAQVSEPMAAPGATVEGGRSNQSFIYSDLEVDSIATVIQLKIVGLKNSPAVVQQTGYRYCSQCGNKIKHADRFCSVCGRRV
jgi:hypothetical protein